ncbi:MAG: hypothetical protein AB9856_14275 [Cellulosilyticaceae bacterium]
MAKGRKLTFTISGKTKEELSNEDMDKIRCKLTDLLFPKIYDHLANNYTDKEVINWLKNDIAKA